MRALEVVLAYARLPSEEQGKVNELLTIISQDRRALALIQEQMMDRSAKVREDMSPSDNDGNVIHVPFGKSGPGRQAASNGPSAMLERFMGVYPNGSCAEFIRFAHSHHPELGRNSLTTTYYKKRKQYRAA